MNTDNIFGIILFTEIGQLINLLKMTTNTNKLSTQYLWKLNYLKFKAVDILSDAYNYNYFNMCKLHFMYHDMRIEFNIQQSYTTLYEETNLCINKSLTNLSNSHVIKINKLPNLKSLSFYWNFLDTISDAIQLLTRLQTINVGYNMLNYLPNGFSSLTNLTSLELQHNLFTVFPTQIFNLTNLTELNFKSNNLSIIPSEICNLTDLQILKLNENRFKNFPAGITKLVNLSTLTIYGDYNYNSRDEIKHFMDHL